SPRARPAAPPPPATRRRRRRREAAEMRLLSAACLTALLASCATVPTSESRLNASQTSEAWRATPPAAGPLGELVTPTFQRFTLERGLTVLVVERYDRPIHSMQMPLRAGSAADPDGKEGLAQLTYQHLLEGAGDRHALEHDNA